MNSTQTNEKKYMDDKFSTKKVYTAKWKKGNKGLCEMAIKRECKLTK